MERGWKDGGEDQWICKRVSWDGLFLSTGHFVNETDPNGDKSLCTQRHTIENGHHLFRVWGSFDAEPFYLYGFARCWMAIISSSLFLSNEIVFRDGDKVNRHPSPSKKNENVISFLSSGTHTSAVTPPSLPLSSLAQGCRFCRANSDELWMQSGSDGTESVKDFWKASCWSWIMSRLACWRSASLSSAVCRLTWEKRKLE